MAKNHIGRPTNEEVIARKRKQMLKVLVPTGIVAVVALAIIKTGSLKNLMGATIGTCEYSCEDGYTYDENKNVCYQEKTNNSEIDAYILGDASITEESSLGVLDARDKEKLASDITNYLNGNITLDERQKIVYDVNQDGRIDSYDVKAFDEVITSTAGTGGQSRYNNIYVCPETKEEVTQVGTNSLTKKIITSYEPTGENGEKCSVTTTERYETEATAYNCTGGLSSTGANNSSSKQNDIVKIAYVLNGGTNNKANPATKTASSSVTLAAPTKTNYVFEGWYKESNFKTKINTITPGTKSVTVYAKWKFDEVASNRKKIKDSNFYKCIQNKLGNKPFTNANLKEIKRLDCDAKKIKSLSGIELLTNLESLSVTYNNLTQLDLSNNPKLETLLILENNLTKLDVSKNPKLTHLYVQTNKLTKLDVSKNPKLKHLEISENKLTSLDVSKNPKLESLVVDHNNLTKLDLSKNSNLGFLKVSSNELTNLNVSKNTKLYSLDADWNNLTKLDVSKNQKLKTLFVDKNVKITGLTKKTSVRYRSDY